MRSNPEVTLRAWKIGAPWAAAAVLALAPAGASLAPALPAQALSGGVLTNPEQGRLAYSIPTALLTAQQGEAFALGKRMFQNRWAFFWFEQAEWGRGPTSNAQACTTCHAGNGRGAAPGTEAANLDGPDGPTLDSHIPVRFEPAPNLVIRVSMKGEGPHGGPLPHPHYGDQLQNFGVKGVVPIEANFSVQWNEHAVTLVDGEAVSLRSPKIILSDLAYGPLGDDVMVAARLAPPVIGLGLLEAVPSETLLVLAKASKPAGIQGRPNYVWEPEQKKTVIGRFGLKANHPTLKEQVAAAFLNDLGLSTPFYPDQNCPPIQKSCQEQMVSGRPEITALRLASTVTYLQSLSVPARRDLDNPQVQRGEALFAQAHCTACHVPELKTGEHPQFPQAANQTIRPYTDLLLHDMGEGLDDHRPDFQASGRDWRTPPLWGIGLSESVNGANAFLHDGRARNFTEAVLWHGGEAEISRKAFAEMTKSDREAVVAFLRSL
ncbi:MAG: c-type cytochrome [Betaproteobacteria bacterium]|nr:c-type cytochrome [Betaproteobacteria bacterium]